MSYVVLARKWRPKQFRDVVGQEHISTTLLNSIRAGRIAHAYLFVGPRGIGKTTTARIFAKALNCPASSDGEPCGQCEVCREIELGRSIDVIEIDGASNNSVEDIRTLRENVKIAPAFLKFKVYIIDEVHMLSTAAFNAFLKTLEEPPAHVKFILATTEAHKIPMTVLSRCQRFDFRRLTSRQIYGRLKQIVDAEHIQIDDRAIFAIARSTEGSMRDALSILDQLVSFSEAEISLEDVHALLGTVGQDLYYRLAASIADGDSSVILQIIDEVIERGKDLGQFLKELTLYFRNLLLSTYPKSDTLIDMPEEDVASLKEVGERFQRVDLVRTIQELSELEGRFRLLPSPRMALEMLLLRLSHLGGEVSIETVLSKLASLEKRIKGPTKSTASSRTKKTDGGTSATGGGGASRADATIAERSTPYVDDDYPDLNDEPKVTDEPADQSSGEDQAPPQMDLWNQFLRDVQEKAMSIYSYLDRGKFCGMENEQIIISFSPEFSYNKSHLEQKEVRMLLEQTLYNISKKKIRIKIIVEDASSVPESAVASSAAPPRGAASQQTEKNQLLEEALKHPLIQKTLELFKGRIVSVNG